MRARNIFLLLVIAALFGSSFTWMRIAVPEMGPVVLAEVRVTVAGLVLALFAGRRRLAALVPDWRRYLVLGLLGAALPFTLISAAEQSITASLAAVLNASVPAMTVVGSALWLHEPLDRRRVLGVGAGMAGVALLTGLPVNDPGGHPLIGSAAMLAAALAYAIALIYTRRVFSGADPVQVTVGQLMGASVLLAPAALVSLPPSPPSPIATVSVLLIAIPGTAVAWPLLLRVVAASGPAVASTVTLLAPVFGLLMGAVLLEERIQTEALPGIFLIAVSLVLISRGPLLRRSQRGRSGCNRSPPPRVASDPLAVAEPRNKRDSEPQCESGGVHG
jgi:drug/metabolite transporter (DMT)-like permease